jgi:hypothetical protein
MFENPIPFKEALAAFAARRLMPTAAGSAEIAQLAPAIRERAFFSAKVEDANFLAQADRLIGGIVSPSSAIGSVPGRASPFNAIEARAAMQDYLKSVGYSVDPAKAGGLQDLSSNTRLDLILKMNTDMAQGAGQFTVQNDPDILDAFPCLELYRLESRKEERNWNSRWVRAGGRLFGGRMIATKDDPIWEEISAFGNAYPPYDYNSGMWTREIDRGEAEDLGVIKRSTVVQPQTLSFNKGVESAFPQNISKGLAEAVLEAFRDFAKYSAGKLIMEAL